jgi:GAF domain-containing protein
MEKIMAESLQITKNASKEEIYQEILPQIEAIIAGEDNLTANLANICAILNTAFGHLWTGFYTLDDKNQTLVLGPFQGPLACTRIPLKPIARGVCGAAAATKQIQIVPDVEKFPGHIACSSASKSEIVLPLIHDNETQLVLDIDSDKLNSFDEIDSKYLSKVISLIANQHYS